MTHLRACQSVDTTDAVPLGMRAHASEHQPTLSGLSKRSRDRARRRRRGRSRLRLLLFTATVAVLVVGIFAYRAATHVADVKLPETGVPPILDGKFLGMTLLDISHHQVANNPWLRLTMNSSHQGANPTRRFQIKDIVIKDGQHPETGEPAILVLLTPKFQEFPDPPFDPIAVRLWQPPKDSYFDQNAIAELQRVRPPNEHDLRHMQEVWSGKRVEELSSLVGSMQTLLYSMLIGVTLILLAGAYRSFQWMSDRWDSSLVQQHKSRDAMRQLRDFRRAHDESTATTRRE